MTDSFRIKYENVNKPNDALETSTLVRQRQINGTIDEYLFQEKATNSHDRRDH